MPRQRKPRVPPELLEKLRELERRAREDSQKTAEVFAKAERLQRRLREIYMSG